MSANLDSGLFGIYEDLILTRNGIWLSNGEEILHERTKIAFARNLFRCKEGFEIRLGQEKKNVHVEDRSLELDPETLRYHRGRLTCRVPHPNEGTREEAKFLTQAYYEILKHLEKTSDGFSVTIEGKTIRFQED